MANPNLVLSEVHFRDDFDPTTVDFSGHKTLEHFLEVDAELPEGQVRILGFGAPYSNRGGFDESSLITPIINPYDLHPSDLTIDKQGKGVGPRMYNTPQAAHGLAELPEVFGAYTFDVSVNTIRDFRSSNKLTQIARHAGRMASARVVGVESVVQGIHRKYGDTNPLLSQPPRAEMRQKLQRHEQDPEVPGEFIIIRNAAIKLHRVGDVPVWD